MSILSGIKPEDSGFKKIQFVLFWGCAGLWFFYGQALALYLLFSGGRVCS